MEHSDTIAGIAQMRPLLFNRSTPILALFLSSGWCLASEAANCDEPPAVNVESEMIPTSRVPLPLATTRPEQKPTSVAYSEPRLSPADWNIKPRTVVLGQQKPVQTMSVLSDWKSAPLGTELSPCVSDVAVAESAAKDGGVRKPASATVPILTEIVQVNWSIKTSSEPNSPTCRNPADFHADHCPIVVWDSEEPAQPQRHSVQQNSPIDASNGIGQADRVLDINVVTSVESQKSSAPDAQTTAELQSLLQVPENKSDVTYMTELSELLQGESNWLFGNAGLLDLAPEEGTSVAGVSYLDDLNSLVEGENQNVAEVEYRNTVVCQSNADEPQSAVPQNPKNPYSSIAPDQNCSNVGGVGVSSLFKSISSVRLNGLSTDPPSRPRSDVALAAELPRPENRACEFMDAFAPVYYSTPVRYGASRPVRNTHVFIHQPLYYEDPNLERCGQSNGCLTTAFSTVHFVTAIAFTPYLTGATHPNECVQSLPDCPTCHSFDCRAYWPGWSWTGAAAQAAAVTGLYFVFVP